MVWINLQNGSGQVLKDIKVKDPETLKIYKVDHNIRVGINRYEIHLRDEMGEERVVLNHELRNKWTIVGPWHTPEAIAEMFGTKVDPDANLPRPKRESFWRMRSKKGSHNYRQKKRLMQDPWYRDRFGDYFSTTCVD